MEGRGVAGVFGWIVSNLHNITAATIINAHKVFTLEAAGSAAGPNLSNSPTGQTLSTGRKQICGGRWRAGDCPMKGIESSLSAWEADVVNGPRAGILVSATFLSRSLHDWGRSLA